MYLIFNTSQEALNTSCERKQAQTFIAKELQAICDAYNILSHISDTDPRTLIQEIIIIVFRQNI